MPRSCKILFFMLLVDSAVNGGQIRIDTSIIYGAEYRDTLPSFYRAIHASNMDITVQEFSKETMTNIVATIKAAEVSSVFILTYEINCTAMVEMKKAFTVFFIGMMRDHCDPLDDYLMYMYPPHYDVMRSMYDGIEAYDWKTAAVFYDGSEDLSFGYQDLDRARQRGINFKVWVIPEKDDDMWGVLKSVRLLGYRTYILLCNYKTTQSVMEKAVFLSMVSEVNHWVVPNLEITPLILQDFLESSVRLTIISTQTIREVLEYNSGIGSTETVSRNAVVEGFTADSLDLIERSCNYAILGPGGCFKIPLSEDKQCKVDQGATSVEESELYYSVGTCTEIYMRWLHDHGPTKIQYFEHDVGNPKGNMTFVGYWRWLFNPEYVPFVQAAIVFPEQPLKIGLVYEPPWVAWHINENTNETSYEGFLIDLLVLLSSQLNFRYVLVYNNILGEPDTRPNGTNVDYEVNRMLLTHEPDMPRWFSPERERYKREATTGQARLSQAGKIKNVEVENLQGTISQTGCDVSLIMNKIKIHLSHRDSPANEVDFFLQKHPIHGGKLEVEEVSVAFQRASHYMVTLSAGNESPVNMWQFLAPFTTDSWMVLWAALFCITAVLSLVNRFNPFEWRKQALDETNEDVDVENFNKLGVGNSFWMAYAGIVAQGVDVEPLSYAGRIITGTWWYFTMLVIAAYTANLTAFLTQELAGDISKLETLLEQEHYSYGVLADSDLNKYYLPAANSTPFTTVREYLKERPDNVFNSTGDILERIDAKGFYFLAPFGEVAKLEQSGCTYARVGEGFWEYQYGLPFQLESKYTAVFSDAISSLRDDGTLQELESKWFNFRGECTEASFDIESNRLGIGNLGGMFILLVMGVAASFIVHLCELLWSKRFKIKKFREMEDRKETSDDPISEMRRRRQRERRELDEKIEEWEGGYEYWMNRMRHINKTLKDIDKQNKDHAKQIRRSQAVAFDSDGEEEKGMRSQGEIAADEQQPGAASIVKDEEPQENETSNVDVVKSLPGVSFKNATALIHNTTDADEEKTIANKDSLPVNSTPDDGGENRRESDAEAAEPDSRQPSSATSPESNASKIKRMLSFSQWKKADANAIDVPIPPPKISPETSESQGSSKPEEAKTKKVRKMMSFSQRQKLFKRF